VSDLQPDSSAPPAPIVETPITETERLSLMAWTTRDAAAAFAIWGDPEVMRFVGEPHQDVARSKKALQVGGQVQAQHGHCLWKLVCKTDSVVVGCCGFHRHEREGTLELAFHIRRDCWGKGYASEAAAGCLRYAFDELGAERVVAFTHRSNAAAQQVLDKIGLRRSGEQEGELCYEQLRAHASITPSSDEPGELDLERLGVAMDGQKLTTTARSLFLTRSLEAQTSTEEQFDPERGCFALPKWYVDTYFGGFALNAELLASWKQRASRVLDLAAGLSAFATEACLLGIEVDCADRELIDGHPSFAEVARYLQATYAGQMRKLLLLSQRDKERYGMRDAAVRLLQQLLDGADRTTAAYPEPSGTRFQADATQLSEVADDSYDVVLSGWLLVHLDEQQEQEAIRSAVRVTKPGGQVRIRGGYGGSIVDNFRKWFGAEALSLGAKRACLNSASYADLLILDVNS